MAQQLGLALLGAVVARHAGHTGRGHDLLAAGLVAHVSHSACGWSYEHDALLLAPAGERRVLRQEPVAWVQGLDAILLGQPHDPLAIQVPCRGA